MRYSVGVTKRGQPEVRDVPQNKGMKLTSVERIGRSQLIPGVGQTAGE